MTLKASHVLSLGTQAVHAVDVVQAGSHAMWGGCRDFSTTYHQGMAYCMYIGFRHLTDGGGLRKRG